MQTQEQYQASRARANALEKIRQATRVEELGTTVAQLGDEEWPVRIQEQGNEMYIISGRSSRFDVYLVETIHGYLVAIPNMQRAGHVPADVDTFGVREYVGVDNQVDATTLAAAVRWLIEHSCEFALGDRG